MKKQYYRSAWIMQVVGANSQLEAPGVSVALLLVCHMDPNANCSVYVKTIAKELRRSERYVQEGLKDLESKGWLMVTRKYDPVTKRNRSNRFTGIIPGVGANSAPSAQIAPSDADCAGQRVQNMRAINNNRLTRDITRKGLLDAGFSGNTGITCTAMRQKFAHILEEAYEK